MKLNEFYKKTLKPMVDEMNLVDVKIYPDADGEVGAVLLKYMVPYGGRVSEIPDGKAVPAQKEAGTEVGKQEALDAYNTLKKYCGGQESCENCLLTSEDETGCIMGCIMGDTPDVWQELEI